MTLRVGCFGAFSGLLSFQRALFEASPDDLAIFVYDVQYRGHLAEFLRPLVAGYSAVTLRAGASYHDQLTDLARAIHADRLDVLLNVNPKAEAYDLLDLVDTPCIINVCTGSDLLHHPRVTFQIHGQPEADYFPIRDRIFCGTTRTELRTCAIHPGWILYDRRDIDMAQPPEPWSRRDPLIVFHGALYKLNSPAFLACLFDLLRADATLEFVFMGKDDGQALAAISRRAVESGLSARVHYEGSFSPVREGDGRVTDPGWKRLLTYLRRARLAPDPWPIGGGSARVEAYLMGVPSVHLALRTDRANWRRPQPTLVDVPVLRVALGTASSIDEYRAIARQCLSDATFADRLSAAQLQVARAVTDPSAYWRQLIGFYREWQARRDVVAGADRSHRACTT